MSKRLCTDLKHKPKANPAHRLGKWFLAALVALVISSAMNIATLTYCLVVSKACSQAIAQQQQAIQPVYSEVIASSSVATATLG